MKTDRSASIFAFTRRFMQLSRSWRQEADRALARLGLSYATAQPMLEVHRLGSAPRQTALAAALGIEGPSLVRLLDQLSAANLLIRCDDPSDRRAKTIRLTAEGSALVKKVEAALEPLRASLLAGVSDHDLKIALRVLDVITATIEREQAAP